MLRVHGGSDFFVPVEIPIAGTLEESVRPKQSRQSRRASRSASIRIDGRRGSQNLGTAMEVSVAAEGGDSQKKSGTETEKETTVEEVQQRPPHSSEEGEEEPAPIKAIASLTVAALDSEPVRPTGDGDSCDSDARCDSENGR